MQRVQKILSNSGFCSRRRAESLIEQGRVAVNGKIIGLGDKAADADSITVDGESLKADKKVYLMLNKPLGCVTALSDKRFKTVMDYIPVEERVFPIGRLDYNTAGLLLFTNDGDFANEVMHPRYEIKKTYLVNTAEPVRKEHLIQLERGILLDDGKTFPAKVRKHTPKLIEITIHEGKNKIVRRMMSALGYRVRALRRLRIGDLSLGNLKPGEFKYLSWQEKAKIFKGPMIHAHTQQELPAQRDSNRKGGGFVQGTRVPVGQTSRYSQSLDVAGAQRYSNVRVQRDAGFSKAQPLFRAQPISDKRTFSKGQQGTERFSSRGKFTRFAKRDSRRTDVVRKGLFPKTRYSGKRSFTASSTESLSARSNGVTGQFEHKGRMSSKPETARFSPKETYTRPLSSSPRRSDADRKGFFPRGGFSGRGVSAVSAKVSRQTGRRDGDRFEHKARMSSKPETAHVQKPSGDGGYDFEKRLAAGLVKRHRSKKIDLATVDFSKRSKDRHSPSGRDYRKKPGRRQFKR